MSKLVLCSVRVAGDVLGAEVVWRYTNAGGRRSLNPRCSIVKEKQLKKFPSDKWCVVSVGEVSAGRETQQTQVSCREEQAS